MTIEIVDQPITEEWLGLVGFKWHQLDRQNHKHWLLWLGDCMGKHVSFEDFGIEVTQNDRADDPFWFCWLRADSAGRYHRFIHVRHIYNQSELIAMIEGLTGQAWNPQNNLCGSMQTPEKAARILKEWERLDIKHNVTERPDYAKWHEIEKDDSRGRALPEHYEAHEKAKAEGKI